MYKTNFKTIVLILAMMTGIGMAQQTTAPLPSNIQEEVLGVASEKTKISEKFGLEWMYSLDAQRVAWPEKRGGKTVMMVNGTAGQEFDKIGKGVFSLNSIRFAYSAERNGKKMIVVDNTAGPEFDSVDNPVFSLNSQHFAYPAKRKNKWLMVLDGKEISSEYESVSEPIFSLDGQHVAFQAKLNYQWVMVLDGKETGPKCIHIETNPQHIRFNFAPSETAAMFHPDQKRLVYFCHRGEKWNLIIGDEVGPDIKKPEEWLSTPKGTIAIFSPDAEHVAFAGVKNKKVSVFLDGKEIATGYDYVGAPLFNSSGEHFVFLGLDLRSPLGGDKSIKSIIVLDGREGPSYEGETQYNETMTTSYLTIEIRGSIAGVSPPIFIEDAKLMYAARRGKDDCMLLTGDEAGPRFSSIVTNPVLSFDGKHVAYLARQDNQWIEVVDGKIIHKIPREGGLTLVGKTQFSPDGNRLSFLLGHGGFLYNTNNTKRARRRVFVDNKEGKEYDAITLDGPDFSPNSQHFAYVVIDGGKELKSLVSIDEREGKSYDYIVYATMRFIENDRVVYIARDGQRFIRVTQTVQ